MFSFKIFQKPNWVNAELKFTLSGDSSSSDESSQSSENDQLKLSEMPIPEYIKEIASRGMLKFWKLIFSFWAWSSLLRNTFINRQNSVQFELLVPQRFVTRFYSNLQLLAEFIDYELGKVLGAGAFGLVISATRTNGNLPVSSSALWLVGKTWVTLSTNQMQSWVCARLTFSGTVGGLPVFILSST